ncbi:MAG: outer membrane beta-barrel protein [Cryomorphaceae bacterium]|nr:outer membrane beta-barrel protein [Cryomorphaceae bacterium]
MIRKSTFLFLSLCFGLQLFAQLPSQRGYYTDEEEEKEKKSFNQHHGFSGFLGIGGSGLAGPGGEQNLNFGSFFKIGLTAGVAYSSPFTNQFDFRAELLYMQKGAAEAPVEDAAASAATSQARIALNCIEIPLGVRYHMYLGSDANTFSNHISADLMLSGGYIFREAYRDRNTDGYSATNSFNSLYLGGIFGVNYHLNERAILTFRWSNSITPVQSLTTPTGTATAFEQVFGTGFRNQTLGVQFEYNF